MGKADLESLPAHTISQRLRRLKQIPPELFPLGMSATKIYTMALSGPLTDHFPHRICRQCCNHLRHLLHWQEVRRGQANAPFSPEQGGVNVDIYMGMVVAVGGWSICIHQDSRSPAWAQMTSSIRPRSWCRKYFIDFV